MTQLIKILSLIRRGLKKILLVLRDRIDLIEVKILLIGMCMCYLGGIYLLYLVSADPRLYGTLMSTAMIHLVGGRALGIATCLSAGIPLIHTIIYNLYLEIVIVLVAYGVVVLFMRNIIQPKLFRKAVRQAELTAQSQKTRMKKFGVVGLFLFVMFPFFMTGPVIGAIIGYLLNYRAINTFLIVFSGTLTSILIYTFMGNNIVKHINQYVHIDVVRNWGSIIVAVLIVVFLIYHLKTIKKYLSVDGE